MITKRCFKCEQMKQITEFYRHPRMADGHLNKCKFCTRIDSKIHRAKNEEKILAYEKERSGTEKRRDLRRRTVAAYRRKYPERTAAYNAVARALRSGRLIKPCQCQGCGDHGDLKGHHEDYRRKLKVVWLCARCHLHHHHVRSVLNGEWV